MEQILKNLMDPSWWFTGIFFVLVGIFLTKLLFNWIPYGWNRLSNYLPAQFIKIGRWNRKRTLLTVKNYRQRDMKVVWFIGRFWTLTLLSFMCIALIFVYFALSQEVTLKEVLNSKQTLVLVPFYVLMFFIIAHKRTLVQVVNAHHRWKRITRNSRRSF